MIKSSLTYICTKYIQCNAPTKMAKLNILANITVVTITVHQKPLVVSKEEVYE